MRFNIIILLLTLPALGMYFNETYSANLLVVNLKDAIKNNPSKKYLNIKSKVNLQINSIFTSNCVIYNKPFEISLNDDYAISLGKCKKFRKVTIDTNKGRFEYIL